MVTRYQPDRSPNYFDCITVARVDAAASRDEVRQPRAELALSPSPPPERGDAARNRALLLDAARRLVDERGAEAVTTDDIAAAAGVGKGTLFRRFGSRAGLMIVLLDEDEKLQQHALLFGPPPLGPGAPALERLIAYGRERLAFVETHHALLSDANRDIATRFSPPMMVHHSHVRHLLATGGTTGDLDSQTVALLSLLDADYVHHQIADVGRTLDELGDAWETVARKLCGT
jgi:AcrR family transcriptional regulator